MDLKKRDRKKNLWIDERVNVKSGDWKQNCCKGGGAGRRNQTSSRLLHEHSQRFRTPVDQPQRSLRQRRSVADQRHGDHVQGALPPEPTAQFPPPKIRNGRRRFSSFFHFIHQFVQSDWPRQRWIDSSLLMIWWIRTTCCILSFCYY